MWYEAFLSLTNIKYTLLLNGFEQDHLFTLYARERKSELSKEVQTVWVNLEGLILIKLLVCVIKLSKCSNWAKFSSTYENPDIMKWLQALH